MYIQRLKMLALIQLQETVFLRADLETVGDVLKLYNEQDEKLFCRNFRNFGSVNYQRLTNYLKENNLI